MTLWKRHPRYEVTLPQEVYITILTHGHDIRQELIQYHPSVTTAIVLQQSLAIGSDTEKMYITRELTRNAQDILYHESGAFVASQILEEALSTLDDAMIDEALQFMAAAHDANGDNAHGSELQKSMRHKHANHAVRMWIKLLGTLGLANRERTTHIEQWWKEVDSITARFEVINIAQHDISCRCLIEILKAFGHTARIKEVTAQLAPPREIDPKHEVLHDLIIHEFANYVISTMIDTNIEMPRIIDCIKHHLKAIACDDYGNYVVQACIESPHCDKDRVSLAAQFDREKSMISAHWAAQDKNKDVCKKMERIFRNSKTAAKYREKTNSRSAWNSGNDWWSTSYHWNSSTDGGKWWVADDWSTGNDWESGNSSRRSDLVDGWEGGTFSTDWWNKW